MKQRVQVIIITVFVIIMLVTSFVFAINHKNKNLNYFSDSGYIISSLGKEEIDNVNKLYFKQNTAYKSNSDNGYIFSNSDGEKVEIPQESFVHYSNGSIMSLKKGVAIDLNEIDSKIIKYYNIFEGSVLNKETNLYKINNLDETITFSKLMYKISDNKYLIAYPNIIIMFSDNQTAEMKDYVEIEYVSKDVIRIYNEESNYQTIASNLYVLVDDVKINLEYKTISKKDTQYLTMADMIINANDNIEVLPVPEKIETDENEEGQQENIGTNNGGTSNNVQVGENNNSQGQINPDLQEGLDNIITGLPNENEQVADEKIVQPSFKVNNMVVNALGIQNITLSFVDESAILYGNRQVEILENSTGKIVKTFDEWEEGNPEYTVNSYFGLKPNTEYTFNVTGQYKIEDTVYDRVFISKIFRTLDIGLEVIEDYITNDSLSFAVYKNGYSNINGFNYEIVNKDGSLVDTASGSAAFGNNDYTIITEENKFSPNTNYTLIIKDIQYGDDIFLTDSYEQLKVTHETKTLKQNPFKNAKIKLTASVDNRENTASFLVEGLNDINGGIKEYTYNIYNGNDELKYTIVKDRVESLTLTFEELNELKEGNIYFDVKINFDDNEKTIIYTSPQSNQVSLEGKRYPKIIEFRSDTNNKDGEKLSGTIVVDDSEGFTEFNQISNYKVVIKKNDNSVVGSNQQTIASIDIEQLRTSEKFEIPITYEGTIPGEEYIIYVYLIDSKNIDGQIKQTQIYLGYVTTKTLPPEPVYLKLSDAGQLSDDANAVFDIKIEKAYEEEGTSDNRLSYLEFKLHACTKISDTEEKCSVIKDAEGNIKFQTQVPKGQDDTEQFKTMLQNYGGTITIYSNDFGFVLSDYNRDYSRYYVTIEGYSFYEIPIKLVDENGNVKDDNTFDITFNEMIPYVSLDEPTKVTKLQADDTGLNTYNLTNIGKNVYDDTIVGFKFAINTTANPKGENINKVYYTVIDCSTENLDELTEWETVEAIPNNKNYINVAIDNNVKRGKEYCIAYYGQYKSTNFEGVKEDKKTNIQKTEPFFAYKQPVDVKGYLKSYEGNNVIFDLTINDPDDAMEEGSLCLYDSDKGGCIIAEQTNSDFVFSLEDRKLAGNSYILKFEESLKENVNVIKNIYEFTPDNIVNFNNLNLIVDTDIPGKVILKLNSLENFNRISGISLGSGATKHYFNFNRDENGNLFVELNLSDIQKNKYAELSGNSLTFNKGLEIHYDSGKIIESQNSNNVYLKAKDNDQKYYNKKLERYDVISVDSIFTEEDVNKLITNNDLIIKSLSDKSYDSDKIGRILQYQFIHHNESTTTTPTLCNKDNVCELKSFTVKNIISTSEINTIYGLDGANVSFKLTNYDIADGTEIKILLNNNEETVVKYNSDGWKLEESNKSENIDIVVRENNSFEVEFKNLSRDLDYKYAIQYKYADSTEFNVSYNDSTQNENGNTNLDISPLEKLTISDASATVTKLNEYGWYWTNESFEDINYSRDLITNFTVDTSNYDLTGTDAEIEYSVVLSRDTTEQPLNIETPNLPTTKGDKISKENSFNLENDYSGFTGTYDVKLIVNLIYSNKTETIKLNEETIDRIMISREPPTFSVLNLNNVPKFRIELGDIDGRLISCGNSYSLENKQVMGYANNASKAYFENKGIASKVVYFELYNANGLVGYSPIPFVNQSSDLDLSTYFSNNKFPSGDYTAKIQYCTATGIHEKSFGPFTIYNSSLDVKFLQTSESFILMLDNPDTTLKDSIKKIVYTLFTKSGEQIPITLSNLDIDATNDIKYVTSTSNGQTNYFLALSTSGRWTSTIEHLQVDFFTSDNSSAIQTVTHIPNQNQE